MKLLINTASTLKGGSLQVAKSFIEECKKYEEHQFYVILGESLINIIDIKNFPKNFTFYEINYRPATKVFSFKNHSDFFNDIENAIKPNIVFTTSGPAYWRPNAPHLVGFNLGHYIYTDSPFFKIIPLWKVVRWKLRGITKALFFKRESDAFVVQTDDVNIRLKKWLKVDKVYTVSNSCNSHFFKTDVYPNKLKEKVNNEFRFLFLSAYHPHKNFEIINSILDYELSVNSNTRIRFVLTLPQKIFDSLFSEKHQKYLYNVGAVPIPECASLYNECDAMFLPTLLECFSASYVEAMFMEKPIVTSNLGFAQTVCKDAALYFNPINEKDICDKLSLLMNNTSLREELIQKGKMRKYDFKTASERAKAYLDICEGLIK
jgi:glycosyltransferase involved in cell wall biosynthesis